MKGSLKKPTNKEKWAVSKTGANHAAQPKPEISVVRAVVTGRFAGMAKTSERINPLIIPGYKTRG